MDKVEADIREQIAVEIENIKTTNENAIGVKIIAAKIARGLHS